MPTPNIEIMRFSLLLVLSVITTINSVGQVGINTTTPSAELEIASSSPGLPILELNPQTAPVGTASGQLSVINDQLYLYDDTRSKWLSIGSSTFNFGGEGGQDGDDLEYAGDIENNGPTMPQDGTIVYISINSTGGFPTKEITINIYNSLNVLVGSHSVNLVGGSLVLADFNVDFSSGDHFRVYVEDANGVVNNVTAVLWTKWRQ